MTKRKKIFLLLVAFPAALLIMASWMLWGGVSNPGNRKTIGDISVPCGFERIEVPSESFGEYIRQFPLKERGSHMTYFSGNLALGQYFGYAVLDLPMLSDIEQCADAVMRMRAEYLWNKGLYDNIHFHSVGGTDQRFTGGPDRNALEQFLRKVYDSSNTSSLRREMKPKSFSDISPGDVFVYESPGEGFYGHAVLVADVAYNNKSGKKAIMLAQSSTPALTMHVIRDVFHPLLSPWVILDESADEIFVSGIHFDITDLREW